MKLTKTGYKLSKNGSIIDSIEKEAYKSTKDLGPITKQDSIYYFFCRKQGDTYVYLP